MSAGSKGEEEGEDAKFDEGHVGVSRVRRRWSYLHLLDLMAACGNAEHSRAL